MRGPFVGREGELNELAEVVASAKAGATPSAAVVIGAPGSGKSRLLSEIINRLQPPVLRVTGYEPEQAVPLTAARELLRTLSRVPIHGVALEAVAFGEQQWGQAGAPLRLFEAAYRCLADSEPVTLVIDDLQWVDDVSAALVSYLVRASQTDGVSLALLSAGRPRALSGPR